METLSDM